MTYRRKLRELKSLQLGFLEYLEDSYHHDLETKLQLCAQITDTQRQILKIERMPMHQAEMEFTEYFIEINSTLNGKD